MAVMTIPEGGEMMPTVRRIPRSAAKYVLPPGPAGMERAFGKRPSGTGSIVRNGKGFRWQLNRTGQSYKGPTVPTRQQATDDLDDAIEAIARGERPVVAKKQEGGRARAKTIPAKALLRMVRDEPQIEYPDVDRPLTRGDCANVPRPCPFVSCSAHLYLDVDPKSGSIKFNRPDLEVWEMEETCSLDVADRQGITLEEVGRWYNLTRERIRQVEVRGLTKIKNADNGELSRPSSPETYVGHQGPHSGAP